MVYAALLLLLALTIAAAAIPHGELSLPIALTISVAKTVLIVLFFMHVRESDSLTKFLVAVVLLWLLLLIGFTMSDVLTRPRPAGTARPAWNRAASETAAEQAVS
jgi:cytochrome c oxidase subunit 4